MSVAGDQQIEGVAAQVLAAGLRHKLHRLETTCIERCEQREMHVQRVIDASFGAVEEIEQRVATSRVPALLDVDDKSELAYVQSITDLYERILCPLRFFHEALPSSALGVASQARGHQHAPGRSDSVDSPVSEKTDITAISGQLTPTMAEDNAKAYYEPRNVKDSQIIAGEGSGRKLPKCPDQNNSAESTGRKLHAKSPSALETDQKQNVRSVSSTAKPSTVSRVNARVAQTVEKYREEVICLARAIGEAFDKLRHNLRAVYRWGQSSVLDLYELLDDTLTEEVYCAVRGKMARCLVTAARLQESARRIEADVGYASFLDLYIGPATSRGSTPAATPRRADEDLRLPSRAEFLTLTKASLNMVASSRRRADASHSRCSSRSSNASSATNPEPPISPRPRKLGTHPKIIKDRHEWFEAQRRADNGLYGASPVNNSTAW